ncbi:MAG: hypothetical protein IJK78_13615 [Bacteroidales bacterium]|nr:hypothetical protein [Bacteroidales bacterium]
MITTIRISTYSLPAYVAIHHIVIKSNVIKRRWYLFCFYCTIRTRRGKETVEALQKAWDDAKIPDCRYEIKVDE